MKDGSYKAMVGSLMHEMMALRANIAFAVSTVSQFMLKASPPYSMAVKHIMRCLKGTLDLKLCLRCKDIALRRFCNADWASSVNKCNGFRSL